VRAVWREEGVAELSLVGATELDTLPQGQPFSFDAQRPALVARGLAGGRERAFRPAPAGLDVVVAFAHRGGRNGSATCSAGSTRRCSRPARHRPG
jgi:hypothetical protein